MMNKPLNILIFAADKGNRPAHFVGEQIAALRAITAVHVDICTCPNNLNVLEKYIRLKQSIKQYHPDVIHAHFGLYGFIANLQRKVPVVTTYHGSDIHGGGIVSILSKICAYFSAYNIYVSKALRELSRYKGKNDAIIPCGVNVDNFIWVNKKDARSSMHLDADKKYILFASDFDTPVKDPHLAFRTINELKSICPAEQIELIELKGYSREEVNVLLHGVDAALMTSHREGSPQFIKEAVICGTPIVTVNVGDVKTVLKDVPNAYVAEGRSHQELAQLLLQAIYESHVLGGNSHINQLGFNNRDIARQLQVIYYNMLQR